jgi:hypothetical protein
MLKKENWGSVMTDSLLYGVEIENSLCRIIKGLRNTLMFTPSSFNNIQ